MCHSKRRNQSRKRWQTAANQSRHLLPQEVVEAVTRIGYNPFFEPREANPLSELPLNKWRERIIATLRGRYLLTGVILAVWLVTIISIATSGRQWDFRTYYYAAIAHAAGENPYDLAVLNKYSQNEIDLPFVYPPLTCYFFRPFTYLPYDTAYQFWLWLKVAIAIYLIWLWRTRFIRWGPLPLMILIVSAAFQSALYRDLASGNVSLLEQAVLWTGFLWLLEQKPYRFALAVVLAALFKVTLAFFSCHGFVYTAQESMPSSGSRLLAPVCLLSNILGDRRTTLLGLLSNGREHQGIHSRIQSLDTCRLPRSRQPDSWTNY